MDPIQKFSEWFAQVKATKSITEPTAMTLATADKSGAPSARIVLLKQFDERGFVFYTNLEGRKSRELRQNPKAALCFYWMPLRRQVRVEGVVENVSDAEADAYFANRPRESQIGAWSKQSEFLESREELMKLYKDKAEAFAGRPIARPAHWSGWRVVPERIEFWEEGEHRLHDRDLFSRKGNGWEIKKLYP